MPQPLYPRGRLCTHLGGTQGRSGRVWKISPPPGFDPRTVQSVPSPYGLSELSRPMYCLHKAALNCRRTNAYKFVGLYKGKKWKKNASILDTLFMTPIWVTSPPALSTPPVTAAYGQPLFWAICNTWFFSCCLRRLMVAGASCLQKTSIGS